MRSTLFVFALFIFVILGDLRVRLLRMLAPRGDFDARLQRLMVRLARTILGIARLITGMQTRVESRVPGEIPQPAIVVCNHQSLIDIAALIYALPAHRLRFVAKEELGRGIPLVSATLRYARHALISRRGRFEQTGRALLRLSRMSGVTPVIFPEGTRSPDGSLLPFHSAAVRVLLEESELPVLAVAVDGGYGFRSLSRVNRARGTVYRVSLLAVHPRPRGRDGVLHLLEQIRAQIAAQHDLWRGRRK